MFNNGWEGKKTPILKYSFCDIKMRFFCKVFFKPRVSIIKLEQ